jgi:hypothetical protein
MIEIIENDIRRGGKKVGFVRDDDIYDEQGHKRGYFSESAGDIFDANGHKIAYLEGNYCVAGEERISLSDIRREIRGGSLSDCARAAVRLLLGD